MRVWNVGIVGGGPGGLMTAYALERLADSPTRITLFEASSRLGGKILTPEFSSASVRYEAGAAEFYDYSHFDTDALKELIEDLGLPISPMGGAAVIRDHRILSNLEDVRDQMGSAARDALVAFDRVSRDAMLPTEFYYSDHPDGVAHPPVQARFESLLDEISDPATRDFVETLIHSDLATEPKRTTPVYGLQNYLMNDPAYMTLYGIVGGNERLPQELAARINAKIRLNTKVQSIAKSDTGRMLVTSQHNEETQLDEFDFVVVALPHNHLGAVSFEGERLSSAVQRHRNDYNFPAHYLRVTILFKTPFWRSQLMDSYWMLDRFGGCCLYDESSRAPGGTHGVLGWLLAGEAAENHAGMSDEQLIDAALDSLPESLQQGREQFVEARVHRWINAVNAIPGGLAPKPLDRRHQPEPVDHPNLYFVGDYLFDSTLNGVVDSADYVAGWLAAQMADATAPPSSHTSHSQSMRESSRHASSSQLPADPCPSPAVTPLTASPSEAPVVGQSPALATSSR